MVYVDNVMVAMIESQAPRGAKELPKQKTFEERHATVPGSRLVKSR